MSSLSQRSKAALKALFFIAFGFFAVTMAVAQTTGFVHFGTEEGLPQSEVLALTQDLDGNLWTGTIQGLSRYNGITFETFTRNNGLAEDWVTAAHTDKQGNVWIGHWAGGVSLFNRETQLLEDLKFERYSDFNPIRDIFEDRDGRLWFATDGDGAYRYDPKTKEIAKLPVEGGMRSPTVFEVCQDAIGNFWFATGSGITILDGGADLSDPNAYHYLDSLNGLPASRATAVVKVSATEMWVGTAGGGIAIVALDANFSPASLSPANVSLLTESEGLSSNHISCIFRDSQEHIWIGSASRGVSKYDLSGSGANRLRRYNTVHGLNYNEVNTIYEDREHNIWIGTDIGINRYRGDRFLAYEVEDGIAHNIVWSVMEDAKGNIWLGTNEGVTRMEFAKDSTSGRPYRITNYTTEQGLGSNVALALHEDAAGNVWVGTSGMGVSRMRPGSGRFEQFTSENGLAGNIVFAIESDAQGQVWIGSMGGATRYDPARNTFNRYDSRDGLGGQNVYSIYKATNGDLWFGMLGGYLTRYRNGEFKIYDEAFGIRERFIQSLSEDDRSHLWMSANKGGIYEFDGTNFQYIPLDDEADPSQPYYVPYSITVAENGEVWMGTNRGIARLDKATGHFQHYGKREGFLGVECNFNAAIKDRHGDLWFGTIMGAVRFSPKEDKTPAVTPVTSLTGLRIYHETAPFPDDASFSAKQSHLTFDFIGVSLTSPEKVRYQYKLEGFDADWSPESPTRQAVYANLPPGKYTFRVRARNGEGSWSENGPEYTFEVQPPWWQTRWFFVICVAMILLVLFLYYKARTQRFRQLQEKLERQVQDSTMEIAEREKDLLEGQSYARQIAETLMPARPVLDIPGIETMVYYRPCAAGAGDFFRSYTRNGSTLVAAVDVFATGLPGTFYSLLGHSNLSQLIEQEQLSNPAEILGKLRERVMAAQARSGELANLADYLELAICAINTEKHSITFAGANKAIFMVRNEELTELMGNSESIGGADQAAAVTFNNQEIELQQGDTIYLFTDGLIRQQGGAAGEAFNRKRFSELLVAANKKPVGQQAAFMESRVKAWLGTTAQQDDILVIGMHF